MKKSIIFMLTAGCLSLAVSAQHDYGKTASLVPEQCTIGERPVCHPIVDIGFTFDGAIGVADNSVATVYVENQPVATGTLSASNYVGKKKIQGTAVISFDTPLVLPKGKTYNLIVPEGVIFKESEPSTTNDKLSVTFEVPDNLGEATPSVENGSTVQQTDRIGFYFGVETASVENGEAILYREDVPVKKYPCDVSWDWDLGYAGIDFGETVSFEAGVTYTVKLPKGSVSSLHRPDITNKEVAVSFIGGYTEPVAPIQYVWCSLFDNHPTDVLGEVKFYYNQPVSLCVNPIVQLYIEADDVIVKESVPTLSEENGKYVMTVDFENTALIPEKGYSIIIPEGTLVAENGNIVVNSRNSLLVGSSSSISDTKDIDYSIDSENGLVFINHISYGNEVVLLSLDGKMVYAAKSEGGTVSIPVGTTGVYLLSIGGKTHKIVVE